MPNKILILLSLLLALIGGTGLFVLSSLLLNSILLVCVVVVFRGLLNQYHKYGLESIRASAFKIFIFTLYLGFLTTSLLRETIFDTEYKYSFTPEGGLLREYTDIFRGFLGFWIVGQIYQPVRNAKIFAFLPPVCIAIVLAGQILEANGTIDVYGQMAEANALGETSTGKLLARPGGFLNANMTGAVTMVWLFVILESKLEAPVIFKGISLLLTYSVCLLAQSRGSILFLTLYLVYKVFISRNVKFLIAIITALIALFVLFAYIDMDFVNDLIMKFTERATQKEESAAERESLIYKAIAGFQETPIFGHGLYHLSKTFGVSSHNQTLEILNNYGLIGFVCYFLFYVAFYHKNHVSYLILCIFPLLLFSHNFFENSAFQMAIGFAYTHADDPASNPITRSKMQQLA